MYYHIFFVFLLQYLYMMPVHVIEISVLDGIALRQSAINCTAKCKGSDCSSNCSGMMSSAAAVGFNSTAVTIGDLSTVECYGPLCKAAPVQVIASRRRNRNFCCTN